MCVSREKSRQCLDVQQPEDKWLLEFIAWEGSLTDTVTSQQAHRFSSITPRTEVVGFMSPNDSRYSFTQVRAPTSQCVMLCVCGLLMWYLHCLFKTSMTDCQRSSNHFDFSIEGWITLEWTLSDPCLKGPSNQGCLRSIINGKGWRPCCLPEFSALIVLSKSQQGRSKC